MGFKSKLISCTVVALMSMNPMVWAESLSDALASAYKSSGLLQQKKAILRAADEDVAISLSALRPTLEYSLSHVWADTDGLGAIPDGRQTTAKLTASMLLYNFGRGKMGVQASKELVLAARDTLVSVEQDVLLRAIRAFWNVLSAIENAALQGNSVRVINQELRAASDRFEVGEVTQTDVAIARARLASARSGEVSARGQLEIAREEYLAAIGHLPRGLTTPPRLPSTAKSLEAAKSVARQRHPDIQAAQHQVAAAEISIKVAKASMLPSVVGQVQTGYGDIVSDSTNGNFTNSVGIMIRGEIYSGGLGSAQYRKAITQAEQARSGLHLLRLTIDQNVANAWSQVAIAAAQLEATDRQIRSSRVALRGAREEATLGSRTILDVLNAEQELLNAEAARISAQADRYYASYLLLSAMGLLTAEHLKLGIVTYDAKAYYNAAGNTPVRQVSPQGQKLDAIIELLRRN